MTAFSFPSFWAPHMCLQGSLAANSSPFLNPQPHTPPHIPKARISTQRPRHQPPVCVDVADRRIPDSRNPLTPATFSAHTSALREGIKAIAVGKNGVKPVPPALIPTIAAELALAEHKPTTPAAHNVAMRDLQLQRASFMGALFVKAKLSPDEMALLLLAATPRTAHAAAGATRTAHGASCTAGELLAYAAPAGADAPCALRAFALRVLSGERLGTRDAAALGALLYGTPDATHERLLPLKALVAHVMRVRHEDAAELAGLAVAAARSAREIFFDARTPRPDYDAVLQGRGGAFVHVAEPFDGTVTWDLLTPLLARHLRAAHGLRVVMGVGESGGPKTGPNLRDVVRGLGVPLCGSAEAVQSKAGDAPMGVAVAQEDASPGLAGWLRLRRTIVKRPAIATVEKYVDVCPRGAAMFIGSAFHGGYVERMATAAEAVGFPAYVVVGGGMEGSTGLGVTARRKATLLVGWRLREGETFGERYGRKVLTYDMAIETGRDGGPVEVTAEDLPRKGALTVAGSVGRIERFVECGESGDSVFDERVFATCRAFDRAICLLQEKLPEIFAAGGL